MANKLDDYECYMYLGGNIVKARSFKQAALKMYKKFEVYDLGWGTYKTVKKMKIRIKNMRTKRKKTITVKRIYIYQEDK